MEWTRNLALVLSAVAGAGMAVSAPDSAQATLTQVGSAAALNANLAIDWTTFGAPGTALSCFCSAPVGPLTVGINGSSGTLNLAREGLDYTGNFAVGANLLPAAVHQRSDDRWLLQHVDPAATGGSRRYADPAAGE